MLQLEDGGPYQVYNHNLLCRPPKIAFKRKNLCLPEVLSFLQSESTVIQGN